MKKKLLFACMLGALTLSSCVDNDESASVTKVRENYIAQKNALAEAAKIEAEAKKLTAEAQAKLAEAQAELARAQAAVQAAQLEAVKAEAELRVLKAQQEIEQLKLKYEAEMAKLQWQIQQDMINMNTQKANALTTAYSAYTSAITTLNNARKTLLGHQTELAKASDPEQYEKTKAKAIASYQKKIDDAKAKIEIYKQYSNYSEDEKALEEKLAKNYLQLNLLNDKKNKAANDWDNIKYYYSHKHDNEEAVQKSIDESVIDVWRNGKIILPQTKAATNDNEVAYTETKMSAWLSTALRYEQKTITPTFTYGDIEVPYFKTFVDGTMMNIDYKLYTYKPHLLTNIEGVPTGTLLADVDPVYLKLQVAKDTAAYNSDIAAAEKAIADAEKAIKDNDLQKKYDDAKTAFEKFTSTSADGYAAAKTAYDAAKSALDAQNDIIETNTETLERTNKQYAAYMILAEVILDWKANLEKIEALQLSMTEAIVADHADWKNAYIAEKETDKAWWDYYDANIAPLQDILYGHNDGEPAININTLISNEETIIKSNQDLIDAYDKSQADAIAALQAQIERDEEAVKNAEINYALRKSNYEAALAAAGATAE